MDKVYITGPSQPGYRLHRIRHGLRRTEKCLGQQYCAARLGQISDETKAVLDKFGAQPPELINNVRTQVRTWTSIRRPPCLPPLPSAGPGR